MIDPQQLATLLIRDLNRAIGELPAGQRAVLLLVTLEDMTYDQVARTLDIPIGTVMSRLARAREKLRDAVLGVVRLRAVN
jgi:RNA polymerase sigma-70 factor, ECF subfamily